MNILSLTPIQILRGSTMDPYILNKRLNDPYDGGNIRAADGSLRRVGNEAHARRESERGVGGGDGERGGGVMPCGNTQS